jgi:uncharacterized membrane-anchored protein
MMEKLSKGQRVIIAFLAQAAVLLALILLKLATVSGGTEVFLAIKPVDPRDFLRGDYMTFTYDISRVEAIDALAAGQTVYVPLAKTGQYWTALGYAQREKPSQGLFIKGKAASDVDFDANMEKLNGVDVIYGIEDYFIPEGSGQGVLIVGDSFAKVVIGSDGQAIVQQIFIDGKLFPAQ